MPPGPRSAIRAPEYGNLRARLKQAQEDEAHALAEVCSAQARVDAAERAVTSAATELASAQSALVKVSGLDRSATLLGASKNQLRRASALAGMDRRPQATGYPQPPKKEPDGT
jgi:hypothetical protein